MGTVVQQWASFQGRLNPQGAAREKQGRGQEKPGAPKLGVKH